MIDRSASILAAALLAGMASTALAQEEPVYDPAALPPLPEETWDREWHADGPPAGPDGHGADAHSPPPAPLPRLAPEQRAAWLDRCSEGHDDRSGSCEAYLHRYERSYMPEHGHPHGHEAYAYGYPWPVMWVRVPIVRERRHCDCKEVIEETVEERPAAVPDKRVRVAPAPDKRVRTSK